MRNLMDLRGAKSNVMSLFGTYRNRNCPLIALVGAWPTALPQDVSCQADCSRAEVAEVDTNFYRVKIEVQQPAIDSKGVNNRKPKNRNTRATCYQLATKTCRWVRGSPDRIYRLSVRSRQTSQKPTSGDLSAQCQLDYFRIADHPGATQFATA
jgi:hypothetical protein